MNIFKALEKLFVRKHPEFPLYDLTKLKHDEAVFLMKTGLSKQSRSAQTWRIFTHRIRLSVLQEMRPLPFPDGPNRPKPKVRHQLKLHWQRTIVPGFETPRRRLNIPYYQ